MISVALREGIFMANWLKIEISSKHTRPIVVTENNISCLIDTGADTPVWTSGSLALVGKLGAKKVEGKHFI